MIKLKKISDFKVSENGIRTVTASLYADTKNEVTSDITGADVEGLLATDILDAGTIVVTASFNVGCLNSSGTWVWKV